MRTLIIAIAAISLVACNNTEVKTKSNQEKPGVIDKWKIIKEDDKNMSSYNAIVSFNKDSIVEINVGNDLKSGRWYYSTNDEKNIEIRLEDKISRMENIIIEGDKMVAKMDGQNCVYYRYGSELYKKQSRLDDVDKAIERALSDIQSCEDMIVAMEYSGGSKDSYSSEIEAFKQSKIKFAESLSGMDNSLSPEQMSKVEEIQKKYASISQKLKI